MNYVCSEGSTLIRSVRYVMKNFEMIEKEVCSVLYADVPGFHVPDADDRVESPDAGNPAQTGK